MNKTALVVDDSKSARFALRKYLENHGYRVDAVESAKAAYELLEQQLPDIIFFDHIMPEIDGFEAMQTVRNNQRTAAIPAVICSSNEGPNFNEEARARGAAAVLQKPPSPEQLVKVLSTLAHYVPPVFTPMEPAAAAKPEVPPPAPAKVVNIREPEVAIEQAVMRAIRTAIPPGGQPPAAAPAPAAAHAPVAAAASAPAAATAPTAMTPHLREQVDERIRKITQDLFVQVAALRADFANFEEQELAKASEGALRNEIAATRASVDALEKTFAAQIAQLQTQMAEGFAALAQSARQAAAEEAHAVSERVVMAAAARISDQLASSIVQAFRAPQSKTG